MSMVVSKVVLSQTLYIILLSTPLILSLSPDWRLSSSDVHGHTVHRQVSTSS